MERVGLERHDMTCNEIRWTETDAWGVCVTWSGLMWNALGCLGMAWKEIQILEIRRMTWNRDESACFGMHEMKCGQWSPGNDRPGHAMSWDDVECVSEKVMTARGSEWASAWVTESVKKRLSDWDEWMKWDETGWDEVRWAEMRWDETRWAAMTWNTMKERNGRLNDGLQNKNDTSGVNGVSGHLMNAWMNEWIDWAEWMNGLTCNGVKWDDNVMECADMSSNQLESMNERTTDRPNEWTTEPTNERMK